MTPVLKSFAEGGLGATAFSKAVAPRVLNEVKMNDTGDAEKGVVKSSIIRFVQAVRRLFR
jgi:hypothetical protein